MEAIFKNQLEILELKKCIQQNLQHDRRYQQQEDQT
jgi:hypothetical protein